ncbi:MAG: putative glycoside hydrolase [Candidatus Hodarchaeota archaeon]
MKIGGVIDQPKQMRGFDLTFYHVKPVNGRINKAADRVYNLISCFGDNKTSREKPEWVAISKYGKAVRRNKRFRFRWDWICPTNKEYNAFLLDLINETSKSEIAGVHLDCVHFPRQEYCTCPRCVKSCEESKLEWVAWRSKIINEFVEQASKLVRNLSVTLTPDPYFAKERFGLDFHSLAKYVDFFVVPLYDINYLTTYWVENLAYCFHRRLEKPLYIELYVARAHRGPTIKNLLEAIVAISNYADGIILATHDIHRAEEIRDKLMKDDKLHHFLKERGCESMMNIIRKWGERGDLHEPK